MKRKVTSRSCLRRWTFLRGKLEENGALIMATSATHAREIAADLKHQGHAAVICGEFVRTDAAFRTAARASKIK